MEPVEPRVDFAALYAEHAPFVRRALMRRGVRAEDLDDLLQETFVIIHRLLPTFEGRASLETWLHSVAWRVAAGHHRRRNVAQPSAAASEGRIADGSMPPPSQPVGLHASLADIDEEQRDIIALHDIGGLSISQLAEITGKARATIRQRLDRARTALGRRMWRALTPEGEPGQVAWLERLSPRLAKRLQGGVPAPVPGEIIVSGETAISVIDDLVIVVWRGASTNAAMEALIEVTVGTCESSPGGMRYLSVIEPTSTPPEREARQMMAWVAGKLGPQVRAAGWAVEDSAMTALVAPVVNACFFLGGVPINMRFFEGSAPAARWLTQYGALEPEQILGHIDAMKRRLSS